MMTHFETHLKAFIDAQPIPAKRLKAAIEYVLFPGGKRFRPHLILAVGKLLRADPNRLLPAAIAIECMHTYSLVHDDLPSMDNDDYRRNRLTCHRAFDEATAILIGDALQNLAIYALTTADTSPSKIKRLIQILLKASGPLGMVSGQSLDLTELTHPKLISISTLKTIHALKTTALICASIEMAIILSPPISAFQKRALLRFGKYLGLAFQMQDDYLDSYDPQAVGKLKSSDQANQKQTFASRYSKEALLTLIKTTQKQATDALNCFGDQAEILLPFFNSNNAIFK